MNPEKYLWVEKYRPKKIDEMVLLEEHMLDMKKYIDEREIPHLFLVGKPGSGKTALARVLYSSIITNDEDNVMKINGSSQKTRGVKFITDVIEPFLKSPPSGSDKIKIVFIDEFDNMTGDAYDSLRSIIENYSNDNRFLLTGNDQYKVPSAIQSRLRIYNFKQQPMEFVEKLILSILENEKIEFDLDDVKYIINSFYPDIRKTIDMIQSKVSKNKLIVNKKEDFNKQNYLILLIIEIINTIIDFKNKKTVNIKKINENVSMINTLLTEENLEFRSIYSSLFYNKNIPANAKIIINQFANEHNRCLVPEMNFSAMVFKIIEVINNYGK